MAPDRCRLQLGGLAELITDKAVGQKDRDLPYVGLEHMAQDSPILLGTASSDDSISTNSIFQPGDVLFGKLRPNLRKSLQVTFPGYCSTDILVLRARPSTCPAFVAKVLQRAEVFREAVRTAEGTKMPRTSWGRLKAFAVFFPPLPEQRRIAEILNTVDAAIQQTDALIAKLNQMKAGLLHDLLTRGLDEHGHLRDPAARPKQFKKSPLGSVPEEWEVLDFGTVVSVLYRYPTYYGIRYAERGVPEIRGELILDDGTLESRSELYRYVSEETAAGFPKVRVEPGDFVMSVRGTLGKIAIVPRHLTGAVITANLIRIQFRQSMILPRWARHFLLSRMFQDMLDLKTSATTIKTVQAPMLNSIPLARPSVEEQSRIADILDAHDARIRAEEACRDKLKQLKEGLMNDLLAGRVRVRATEEATA